MADRKKLLVVLGPTASGKSDLALYLARQLNGEVVSADSMQVYRGMDIGTAKLPPAERQGIAHHLLDVCFSAHGYEWHDGTGVGGERYDRGGGCDAKGVAGCHRDFWRDAVSAGTHQGWSLVCHPSFG